MIAQTQTNPLVFRDMAHELIAHLPQVTSTQLELLRDIETAAAARRREIEQQCAPTVVAPRPAVGETRGREAEPLPPPPPHQVQVPPPAPHGGGERRVSRGHRPGIIITRVPPTRPRRRNRRPSPRQPPRGG